MDKWGIDEFGMAYLHYFLNRAFMMMWLSNRNHEIIDTLGQLYINLVDRSVVDVTTVDVTTRQANSCLLSPAALNLAPLLKPG